MTLYAALFGAFGFASPFLLASEIAKHIVEIGDFIQEAFVFAGHLVPRTQSSTSAGTERSVTSLAIC